MAGNGKSRATKAQLIERLDAATQALNRRADGWMNLFTGMGIAGKDKRLKTEWKREEKLTQSELEGLYRGEGFSQRIVDMPANDATREWFRVEGDDENNVLEKLKSLQAKTYYNRVLRWSRLYGGAVLIAGIKDGGSFEDELREDNIDKVEFLRVENRHRAVEHDWYDDPNNENYGAVRMYHISPIKGEPYYVHASRIRRFDGVDVPDSIRQENNGWGDSVLQAAYSRLRGLGEGYCNIETILGEFILGALKINNLAQLIATGRESLIQKRLQQMDLSKHVMNTILLDNEEDYQRLSAGVGGMDLLLDRLAQALSAVSGIPIALLLGQSPAGLQATGASDIRFYYDMIAGIQETKLQPNLEWLIKLLYRSHEKPFNGNEPDGWKVEFNALWQPTDKELADLRNVQSQSDERYILAGVLDPDEVAISRFGGGSYSLDTTLREERNREKPGEDLEGEPSQSSIRQQRGGGGGQPIGNQRGNLAN